MNWPNFRKYLSYGVTALTSAADLAVVILVFAQLRDSTPSATRFLLPALVTELGKLVIKGVAFRMTQMLEIGKKDGWAQIAAAATGGASAGLAFGAAAAVAKDGSASDDQMLRFQLSTAAAAVGLFGSVVDAVNGGALVCGCGSSGGGAPRSSVAPTRVSQPDHLDQHEQHDHSLDCSEDVPLLNAEGIPGYGINSDVTGAAREARHKKNEEAYGSAHALHVAGFVGNHPPPPPHSGSSTRTAPRRRSASTSWIPGAPS